MNQEAAVSSVLAIEDSTVTTSGQTSPCENVVDWLLVEDGFTLAREHEIESIFTIGNGNTGTRGSLEEGSQLSAPATFVAGVFTRSAVPGSVPELLTFPNWIGMKLFVNGSALTVEQCELLEHRRVLDLQQATLCRHLRVRDAHGRITRLSSLRAASLADRNLLLQRVVVTAENYCLRLDIETTFDLGSKIRTVPVVGTKMERDPQFPNLLPLSLVLSNEQIAAAFCVATQMVPLRYDGERQIDITDKRITERLWIEAGAGAACELHRFVSIFKARDSRDPIQAAVDHCNAALSPGIWSALSAHKTEWRDRWTNADIEIKGDAGLQKALRFGSYHLISAANPEDDRVSIAARALTGHAYKGHVFWDTEIYMLPFFVHTHPESARALLGYRYHTLPAALEKARSAGYRGAMYAWESADTGQEVTPSVVIAPTGEVLHVLNGEMEVHITADIAYAVWQYWNATGDEEFLLNAGAEIILQGARFWASRGQLESDGLYHIRHVIGPDEYHQDVDDNAFTNLMAAWALRRGVDVAELLKERWRDRWLTLAERIQLLDSEVSVWPKLADVMASGFNSSSLLFEQFAGYFSKEHVDLKQFEPRFTAVDVILGHKRVRETDIVKQADVVMAIYLLWNELPPDVREANFRFYEPRTAHGSSLSPSIHALVAARLGDMALARQYLKQSAEIDLGNTMGNAAGGIHAAAIGGLWQAMIFGFGGFSATTDAITLRPQLLPKWRRVSFPLRWRDHRLRVSMEQDAVQLSVAGTEPLRVRFAGSPDLLALPDRTYMMNRAQSGWGTWRTME
jgi:trehalose/maltose hydrolase-like predicted phosphorylase